MKCRILGFIAASAILLGSHAALAQSVLRIGIHADPDRFDPALSSSLATRIVFTMFCDRLFDISADLKIVPQLAESYAWSDNGIALTIKLRPNLTFHDGEPLNAEAVKYNIDRYKNLKGSFRRAELADVTSMDVLDPVTLRINLAAPSAPLLANFTSWTGAMLSPKAAEALGENFGTNPVCAGPFKYVSRVAQGRIVLEKFDRYWDAKNIHFDRVEVRAVSDSTVRLTNLQSGEFDIIERVSSTSVDQVRSDSRLKLLTAPEIGYGFMQFNIANGARSKKMSDPRVREAIDLAIDRQTLVKVAFQGHYLPGDQIIAPGSYYHEDRPVQARNVERAKKLLAEADAENLTFEYTVATDRDFQVAAQILQSMLAEAGITMVIKTVDVVTLVRQALSGDFEAYTSAWSGRIDPDGNAHFFPCGAPNNRSGYCNKELDALLKQARESTEPAERKALYGKAFPIIYRERPNIALWHGQHFMATRTRVQGFEVLPDGMIRLRGVRLN